MAVAQSAPARRTCRPERDRGARRRARACRMGRRQAHPAPLFLAFIADLVVLEPHRAGAGRPARGERSWRCSLSPPALAAQNVAAAAESMACTVYIALRNQPEKVAQESGCRRAYLVCSGMHRDSARPVRSPRLPARSCTMSATTPQPSPSRLPSTTNCLAFQVAVALTAGWNDRPPPVKGIEVRWAATPLCAARTASSTGGSRRPVKVA
jgi:hypothetical protein